ncbi:hypothetical protein ACKVV7_011407 [Pyricularia oryzae]
MKHFQCGTCAKVFPTGRQAREDHISSSQHHRPTFECDSCPRFFQSESARQHHMTDCNHFSPEDDFEIVDWSPYTGVVPRVDKDITVTCDHCDKADQAKQDLDKRVKADHIFECNECDKTFPGQKELGKHLDDDHSWDCNRCHKKFSTEKEVTMHEHNHHNYCQECDRTFGNRTSLGMHFKSSVHRSQPVQCPFCKVQLATASGLIHHLENSTCPKAKFLNLDTVYAVLRLIDSGGFFTKKLIEPSNPAKKKVVGRAHNEATDGWDCCLCHKVFRESSHLKQHLSSPAHRQRTYHCPQRICYTGFKTVGGLVNHIESEICGFCRFEDVQSRARDLISGKLLKNFQI